MRRSKKSPTVNTKKKGAMEMAKAVAHKVKIHADKQKGKRVKEPESDDELVKRKKNEQDETEEEESGEGKSEASDDSSETEIQTLQCEAEVEDQNKILDTLHKDKEQLKVRIKAAKKKNEAKLTELRETLNAYPGVRYALFYNCISQMLIIDFSRNRRNRNCHRVGKRRK